MFNLFPGIAVYGMSALYMISMVTALRDRIRMVYVAQFVKSTGLI